MKVREFRHVLYSFVIISLLGIILSDIGCSYAETPRSEEFEWWIEVEISSTSIRQDLNDDILVKLHDEFLITEQNNIESWHFFREPKLRFRIELRDKENRDRIAKNLEDFLDSLEIVEDFYFAKHGKRVENLDEGYSGERDQYKRMWPYQKKLWEWGSEMTVEAIKEFKETQTNDPPREYQLNRFFHLLSLQLSPTYDVRYCFQIDTGGGLVVWFAIAISFILGLLFCKLRNLVKALSRKFRALLI